MTVPKVETKFVHGDRWYVHDGHERPGVSGINDTMNKPGLKVGAAKEAALFCVRNIDTVASLASTDRKAAFELVRDAYKRVWGTKADSGTNVHGNSEEIARAVAVGTKPKMRVSKKDMPYLRNYARFFEEFKVKPILIEVTVWDNVVDYAGTLDLYAEIEVDGKKLRAIVDTKSGASGVYPEAAIQQVAYAKASHYIDPETGKLIKMPRVDAAFALWLRPDGWALIPLDIGDEVWEQFKRNRATFAFKKNVEPGIMGKPINQAPLKKKWKPLDI